MNRTLLIFGKNGQLARALQPYERADIQFVFLGRDDVNMQDAASVGAALMMIRPFAVLNTAAYTAVDLAETERDEAFALNGTAVHILAGATAKAGIPLIHISTDFVFDGALGRPYIETDAVHPLNIYGASKLEGERLALAENPQSIILRTAWLTGGHTRNFLPAILARALSSPDPMQVNDDQFGSPTLVQDLAAGLMHMVEMIERGDVPEEGYGVFHIAGVIHASRFEFAQAIVAQASMLGAVVAPLQPVKTIPNTTPAQRPMDTRLNCKKLKRVWRIEIPSFRDHLTAVVAQKMQEIV